VIILEALAHVFSAHRARRWVDVESLGKLA